MSDDSPDDSRESEIPPPAPVPGGFRSREVTEEELVRIRDSFLGVDHHNGAVTEWGEMKRAFGDFVREGREQQGQFRDEAAKDRRALMRVVDKQIEEGRRNLDAFVNEGQRCRADNVVALQAFGAALDRFQAGFDRMQQGFERIEGAIKSTQGSLESAKATAYRFAGFLLLAVVIALGMTAMTSERITSLENRMDSLGEREQ